jgi:L,D-transpeptidase catalytic domain
MKRNLSFTIVMSVSLMALSVRAMDVAPKDGSVSVAPRSSTETPKSPFQQMMDSLGGYRAPKIGEPQGTAYCKADFRNMIAKASNKSEVKRSDFNLDQIVQTAKAAGANEKLVKKILATFIENKSKIANQTVVSFADYSLPVSKKRFFMIELPSGKTTSYRVAHGKGSDPGHTGRLQSFSNVNNTNASSEGCSLTGSIYNGSHGKSLNLHGFEKTNNNNCSRRVVMHSNHYMNNGKTGRSWGCPVFSDVDKKVVLQKIESGSITCNFRGDGKSNAVSDDSKATKITKSSKVKTRRSRRSRA